MPTLRPIGSLRPPAPPPPPPSPAAVASRVHGAGDTFEAAEPRSPSGNFRALRSAYDRALEDASRVELRAQSNILMATMRMKEGGNDEEENILDQKIIDDADADIDASWQLVESHRAALAKFCEDNPQFVFVE